MKKVLEMLDEWQRDTGPAASAENRRTIQRNIGVYYPELRAEIARLQRENEELTIACRILATVFVDASGRIAPTSDTANTDGTKTDN